MTNPELGSREYLQYMNQQPEHLIEFIAKFKAFSKMDHETLENYLKGRVPTPTKDKPFSDEPSSTSNPALVEMMDSSRCFSALRIITRVRNLFAALLAALALWLLGGHILLWVFLGIVVVVDQGWLIKLQLGAQEMKFLQNYWYVRDLASRYHDPVVGHQTYWDLERMKKWAVARYDIPSAETFMAIMGREGEMMETGPMAGRFISTTTGEEWPLKPVNA